MKLKTGDLTQKAHSVAPLVGAWIEILMEVIEIRQKKVAPLVGAWIEIQMHLWSLEILIVAPLVGAWIEMDRYAESGVMVGRSSCRSVD